MASLTTMLSSLADWLTQEPEPSILQIPNEILLMILSQLPLPSQACLALSCKTLYHHLSPLIFQHKSLAWPKLLASKTFDIPKAQISLPRNQLLLQLEDDRWLYCSRCFKLHPRAAFTWYWRSAPSSFRRCDHMASVVDLCPCIALTLFDIEQLATWLQTGTLNHKTRSCEAFQLQDQGGSRELHHYCSITDHADVSVNLLRVKLDLWNDHIYARSRYQIHMQTEASVARETRSYTGPARAQMEPVFVCPHLDLVNIIYYENYRLDRQCTKCFTKVTYFTGDDPDIEMCVSRELGDINELASCKWRTTSRLRVDYDLRAWYIKNGVKIDDEPFEPTPEALARWYGSDGVVDRSSWRFQRRWEIYQVLSIFWNDIPPKNQWIE